MARELPGAFRGIEVPEAQRLILAGRGNLAAVRADGQGGDLLAVPMQRAQQLAAGYVPETNRAIPAAGNQKLAVLAVGQPRCVRGISSDDERAAAVDIVAL